MLSFVSSIAAEMLIKHQTNWIWASLPCYGSENVLFGRAAQITPAGVHAEISQPLAAPNLPASVRRSVPEKLWEWQSQ